MTDIVLFYSLRRKLPPSPNKSPRTIVYVIKDKIQSSAQVRASLYEIRPLCDLNTSLAKQWWFDSHPL